MCVCKFGFIVLSWTWISTPSSTIAFNFIAWNNWLMFLLSSHLSRLCSKHVNNQIKNIHEDFFNY